MTRKCDEKQLRLHDWETLSEHNLSIMTQWGKHKTVILLALKHSIIEKTWSIIYQAYPLSKCRLQCSCVPIMII